MEDYKDDVFVRKVDKQGEVLWEKLYGMEEGGVYLGSIWVDHKNSINIGAKRSSDEPNPNGPCIQSWIFNIDSIGEIQKEWYSAPCGGVNVIGIHPTKDSSWIYATEDGKYFMYGQYGRAPMIKQLNGWETSVGLTYDLGNYSHDMVKTELGKYVMCGKWVQPEPVTPDTLSSGYYVAACLFSVDTAGNRLWERCDTAEGVNYTSRHTFRSLVALPSGSIVAVGRYKKSNTSYGWVVKVNKDGCLEEPCRTTSTGRGILQGNILYPNPTSDYIYFKDEESHKYRLYTMQGQLIKTGNGRQIDLSDLPGNMYLLKYRKDRRNYIEKVVKM